MPRVVLDFDRETRKTLNDIYVSFPTMGTADEFMKYFGSILFYSLLTDDTQEAYDALEKILHRLFYRDISTFDRYLECGCMVIEAVHNRYRDIYCDVLQDLLLADASKRDVFKQWSQPEDALSVEYEKDFRYIYVSL